MGTSSEMDALGGKDGGIKKNVQRFNWDLERKFNLSKELRFFEKEKKKFKSNSKRL